MGAHLSLWLEHLPLWLERSLSALQSDFHFRMSILIFVVAVIGHGYSTTTAKYMWGINFPFGVLIMSLILQHCLIDYSELIQNFMPIFLSPVLSAELIIHEVILRNISSPDRSFWKPVNMTDFASVLLDRALTHWSQDQIDAISHTFSKAFSRMKMNFA